MIVDEEEDRNFWQREAETDEMDTAFASLAKSAPIAPERLARFRAVGRQTDAEEVLSPVEAPEDDADLGLEDASAPSGSAPPLQPVWESWNKVSARNQEEEERRIDARDGKAYTWEEFQAFDGAGAAKRWIASAYAEPPYSVWPRQP